MVTPNVLRRAQLPGDLFARENVRLDSTNFFKLWRAIQAESEAVHGECPAPLNIAKVMSSDWFDPELFAALCSANLGGALDRIAKYVRLVAPIAIKIDRSSTQSTVTIDFLDPVEAPPAVFLAFKLVFFVQLARLATRYPVNPLRVSWPLAGEPEPDLLQYKAYFGVPVGNSPLATLVFAASDIDRPFLTENHKMWSFFEPALRQRLADLDRSASMAERLRSVLLEALPAGDLSMRVVCSKLGVSTRTLQRRLKEEGTSFQETLDGLRESLAKHYLQNSTMSAAEISFLLGFEDPNSFARAFQARTGTTPQAVRIAGSDNAAS
ncbi:AraC family transcriptional regulator [Ralstonia pseudosolanacearum]|uniref:AraC family transcriptional regulator n=2 Tax=Ralstonia pseudosolanacearum TaxID=1310165 RepID=UPI001FF8BEC7|nr:AraC family transcriptional regulator [Ralstonia pseudosolanacearum]UWD91690.1 AraC family transcriptional regulator [Ralstonia pseudosolanacearum]